MPARTVDELTLDEPCPRCSAQPGRECDVKAKGRCRFHAGRIDRGLRAWRRLQLDASR